MARDQTPDQFPGFTAEALAFLDELAANNNTDWFHRHKDIYDTALRPVMKAFVRDAAQRLEAAGTGLTGSTRSSLFRINRDIRFSDDKRPYKGHLACYFSRSGEKRDPGGVYVHVQPMNSFFGAGLFGNRTPLINAMRDSIAADPPAFEAMCRRLEEQADLHVDTWTLAERLPRRYQDAARQPGGDYLYYNSFIVRRRVSDFAFFSQEVLDELVTFARDVQPLLQVIWAAMDARDLGHPMPRHAAKGSARKGNAA
jgi:uncharacterized protein (TIGR02453 family)